MNDRQLATMRAQAAQLLPQTAAIQTESAGKDAAGRPVPSWSTVATVAARIDPMGTQAQIALMAGKESQVIRYRLTVPHDAPITAGGRVVIDGNTYEITQLDADHAWRVVRRAMIAQIR